MRLLLLLLLFPVMAQAQISFVNASTDRNASDTSRTPSEPASVQADDLLIGSAHTTDESGTWSCPSGWTEIDNQTQANESGHSVVCYIKRGASAPNLAFSYSGAANDIRATIWAFRGQDLTSPFDVTYSSGSHYTHAANSPLNACGAITTTTDGAVVFLIQHTKYSAAGTPGAPSGYTLQSTGFGSQPQSDAAYKTVTSAGTETPGAWTHTSFNGGDDPQCYTLAIKLAADDAAVLRRRR